MNIEIPKMSHNKFSFTENERNFCLIIAGKGKKKEGRLVNFHFNDILYPRLWMNENIICSLCTPFILWALGRIFSKFLISHTRTGYCEWWYFDIHRKIIFISVFILFLKRHSRENHLPEWKSRAAKGNKLMAICRCWQTNEME